MILKNPTPQILLGFDFGTKRIGVAVGQLVTRSAQALGTIKAVQGIPQGDVLEKYVKKWQPDALVVGIPLNMDGTEQPLTYAARQFAQLLEERFHLCVYEVDERLSTKDAREQIFTRGGFKALKETEIDSVAAQLILQNWLKEFKE